MTSSEQRCWCTKLGSACRGIEYNGHLVDIERGERDVPGSRVASSLVTSRSVAYVPRTCVDTSRCNCATGRQRPPRYSRVATRKRSAVCRLNIVTTQYSARPQPLPPNPGKLRVCFYCVRVSRKRGTVFAGGSSDP